MGANLSASLAIAVSTPGAAELAKLSAHLDELAKKARTVGIAWKSVAAAANTQGAVTVKAGRQIREAGEEVARSSKKIMDGVPGTPRAVTQIRTLEQEMERLGKRAAQSAITAEAREKMGMPKAGFLTGHGFATTARQSLGVARDFAVAAYGVKFAVQGIAATVGAVMHPMVEYQALLTEMGIKGGYSAEQIDKVSASIKDLAGHSSFSPTQQASAGVELAAAGIPAEDMGRALPSTLRFAQSSDLGSAAPPG